MLRKAAKCFLCASCLRFLSKSRLDVIIFHIKLLYTRNYLVLYFRNQFMIIYQASQIFHFFRKTGFEVKPKDLLSKYSLSFLLWKEDFGLYIVLRFIDMELYQR